MRQKFRIADWTVQPDLNTVENGERQVRLEPKVMQVLLELSAHAGDVVRKDELMLTVWPNTFVSDDVLIRCISELRHVFGDSPRSPRVIQTISKVGYRLIAPVSLPVPAMMPARSVSTGSEATTSVTATADTALPIAARVRRSKFLAIAGSLVLVLAVIWTHQHGRSARADTGFKLIPVTSYSGAERQPSFSPDGNHLAFTWNGEEAHDYWNIYVKQIGSENPLALTSSMAEDMSPAWSPDGKLIGFIRRSLEGNAIFVVPAAGGHERKLFDLHCAIDWDDPGLSWSPDGKQLAFPDGKSESSPSSIVLLSIESLKPTVLTTPDNSWDGDFSPAFSPDGRRIAFVRGTDIGSRSIYVISASGGEPKQLTSVSQQIRGLAWTRDGNAVVYSSDTGGTVSLWRVDLTGGSPQRMPFGSNKAFTPAVSWTGRRLAFAQGSDSWNIMRLDLANPHTSATRLLSSTEQDSAPKYSHDGERVAFQSWRSGTQEIWMSSADTARPVKLTSFNGPLTGSPSWSPDDKQLAFDSRVNGHSQIFVLDASGGVPRRVTRDEFNDIVPNWSHDGKWIYFGSRRNGSWQVWKVSIETSEVRQVTREGGFVAQESADGHWVYFTKYDLPGLWRIPTRGGEEVKILDNPPQGFWGYFNVAKNGVYVLSVTEAVWTIMRYDSSTNTTTRMRTLKRKPALFSGLTVSPDGRWMLYPDVIARDSDLVLVENFH